MSRIEEALEKATKKREEQKKESDTTEESIQGKKYRDLLNKPRKAFPAVFYLITLMLVLFVTVSNYYLLQMEGKKIKGSTTSTKTAPSIVDNQWLEKTPNPLGKTYKVQITKVAKDLFKDLPGLKIITLKELSENEFYSISIKAMNDCIPEDTIRSLYDGVSLIKDGKYLNPQRLSALDHMRKIIYRPKACGGNSGAIYFRFYIACPREINPEGFFIDGKEIFL